MLQNLVKFITPGLAYALKDFGDQTVEELRLRIDRPAVLHTDMGEYVLSHVTTKAEIKSTLLALTGHSLHAYATEICQGFFTLPGGIRIGVSGTGVAEENGVRLLRDFTGLNLRFPSEALGIGKLLIPYITENKKLKNTLILSPPQFGKTTLVRDITRAIADGDGYTPQKCVVIDERGEISGMGQHFDLGLRSDVLLCPKTWGMNMALRSLSPQVLVTDEVGGGEELSAVFDAINAGVSMLCTAHADSITALQNRYFFKEVLRAKVFSRFVILSESLGRGTVQAVLDENFTPLLPRPILLRPQSGLQLIAGKERQKGVFAGV